MSVRTNILVNNFSSGELSDELQARVDLGKYQNGCRILINWLPLIEGGIMRRPGTRFVAAAKYGTRVCRLIPFIFSTVQAYIVEVGHEYMRFYTDGGQIENAGSPVELTTPYQEADVAGLKVAQDADTLYLVHRNYPTKKLTRTSHTDWALSDVDVTEGPFLDPNADDSWTITASGGEIMTNGSFSAGATGWSNLSVGTGTFTIVSDAAQLVHGGAANVGACETSFPTLIGAIYTITFDVGTNSVKARVGTATGLGDVSALTTYTTGTGKSVTFVAKSSTTFFYVESGVASATSTLDNVSCLKPLHTGASVTLTASKNTWTEQHVGALWQLSDANGSPSHAAWTAGETISTLGTRRVYNGHVYEATSTGTSGTRPPVHLRGLASDGNNTWTYINHGTGYVKIVSYLSPTSVSAVVKQHLPANVSTGTTYWAEGAWSVAQGYPRAITFIEQRLTMAGPAEHPARVDQSESGIFESFKAGTEADRALSFTLGTGEVNAILWLVSGTAWFAGTNGSTFALSTANAGPLAPDNLPSSSEVDTFGSADVQPLKVAGRVLYIQRGGKRVREISWQQESARFVPLDRTVLARHITSDTATIQQWAYEQDPNSTIWAVRSDGTLLALTYFPEQEIVAWSRHTTDGAFESVASIPTMTSDRTYLVVHRVVNGVDVRYIEYFDATLNTDCALTYDGSAITAISASSLAYLLGKTVDVIPNGSPIPAQVVTTANLPLGSEAVYVEVGLPYDSDCETVRPEVKTQAGSIQGLLKRMTKLTARVVSTNSLTINGAQIETRAPGDYMDTGAPYVTGDVSVGVLGSTTTGTIRIQQTNPLPAKVLGVFATLDSADL